MLMGHSSCVADSLSLIFSDKSCISVFNNLFNIRAQYELSGIDSQQLSKTNNYLLWMPSSHEKDSHSFLQGQERYYMCSSVDVFQKFH